LNYARLSFLASANIAIHSKLPKHFQAAKHNDSAAFQKLLTNIAIKNPLEQTNG
jgi:hypothetical protein